MDARGLTSETFARWDGREPVLLTGLGNCFGDPEQWQRRLCDRHGGRPLGFRQRRPDGEREPCRGTLAELLGWLDAPSAPRGVLAMDEMVVSRDEALQPAGLDLLREDFLEQLFPPEWCPPKYCLVLGTGGARSGLHTDPFGWTGWNICLRGEKVWRFVEPSADVERALYVERPARTNLAAHGDSPVDLYAARDGTLDDADHFEARKNLAELGPEMTRWPRAADVRVAREVVQQPGEIIVFPSSWWHQTLHLSATVAVASQYVNRHSARYVLDRLLLNAQIEEAEAHSLAPGWRDLPWQEQVRAVCAALEAEGWMPRRPGAASEASAAQQ